MPGKPGPWIGVFLFLAMQSAPGLRGMVLLSAGIAVLDLVHALVLPPAASRALDGITSYPAPLTPAPARWPGPRSCPGRRLIQMTGRRS
jgi:hypothetical protein